MRILHPEAETIHPPRPAAKLARTQPPFGGCRANRDTGQRAAEEGEPDTGRLAPVVAISAARRKRAFALLAGEEIPDQRAEARAWNDRPRGAA